MASENDRTSLWDNKWSTRQIQFHKIDVNEMLEKHIDKLKVDGKLDKIFFPLCGKAIDMKWLSDQGTTVIGVDIIPRAIQEFFTDNKLEHDEFSVPSMGSESRLVQTKDEKIKLYCGDILDYNECLDGKFDAIWDRGALVALNRPDIPSYVKLLKSLLNPGGKILLETVLYDHEDTKDESGYSKHPPPHPMTEEDVRRLYEPDCSVDLVDEGNRKFAQAVPCQFFIFLITKK